jgi:hypothetical protein
MHEHMFADGPDGISLARLSESLLSSIVYARRNPHQGRTATSVEAGLAVVRAPRASARPALGAQRAARRDNRVRRRRLAWARYLDLTALGRQEDWEEPKGRAAGARAAQPGFAD